MEMPRQLFDTLFNKPITPFTQQSAFPNHTPPFYSSRSTDAWFTMEKSSIITHYIAARGWGRIYTPYNYNWKPSRSWFGGRSKKSPPVWGDYTSSAHALLSTSLVCARLPKVSITQIPSPEDHLQSKQFNKPIKDGGSTAGLPPCNKPKDQQSN